MNAGLKKVQARAKQLKKLHPGKKFKTLQKQASREYKSGSIPKKRKKIARRKSKPVKRRRVAAVHHVKVTPVRKRKRSRTREHTARKTRRRVGVARGGNKWLLPAIVIGAGLLLLMGMKGGSDKQWLTDFATRLTSAGDKAALTTAINMMNAQELADTRYFLQNWYIPPGSDVSVNPNPVPADLAARLQAISAKYNIFT